MNIDFAAVLVALTALTGVIWGLDAVLWKAKRRASAEAILAGAGADESAREQARKQAEKIAREPHIVEYARSFFPVILIVLLLRSFLVEPFRIPSNSMMPTLLTGDFILVNKFAYGIRLPVIDKKIVAVGSPQRGDVIVFRFPKDPSIDYIKRVIGLPGDHVVYRDKVLYINGQRADQVLLGPYTGVGSGMVMTGATQLVEKLDDVKHDVLIDPRKNFGDIDLRVPDGHYFAMGDNRDNSNDSRFWGPVPEANLVGKAFMIWMNFDSANTGIDWSRIGSHIK
jgi:signal peptidase I